MGEVGGELLQALVAVAQAAGQGYHGNAGLARDPRHAHRGLAVQALRIQTALAGQHQVGTDQRIGQPGQLRDQFDAWAETRAEECPRGETQAAGGADARHPAEVLAKGRRDHLGEVRQGGIQLRHLFGAGALLRTEHRRRAARPA